MFRRASRSTDKKKFPIPFPKYPLSSFYKKLFNNYPKTKKDASGITKHPPTQN
jgi:hypothetical protein